MKCFISVLFYIYWIYYIIEIEATSDWSAMCPKECHCHLNDISQSLFARWKNKDGAQIKSAMCVYQNGNIVNMYKLPSNTEALTFLQALDNFNLTLNRSTINSAIKLKFLDFQGSPNFNYLHITDDIFHDMRVLKVLSLQRVQMTEGSKAFRNLQSLEVLQILHCNFAFLKWEMFDGLSSLRELYLIQNRIKKLQDFAFYGTPELQKLYLSHNDLFSVDADNLVGLLKLEYLDLSNNKIDHLSGLTFPPMPHLQWLELKHNPIRVIFPHCFQFLNGTQHLTLGHKHQAVHLMKFSFRGLFSLIYLHIPNIENDILNEHMFYDLHSLLHLNLQGKVKMIGERAFFGAHSNLEKLILHSCMTERITLDAFHGLHNLKTLDLSNNELYFLPERLFDPLESIVELILSNNKFKSLPREIFQNLNQLQSLRLDANPWSCDCSLSSWKKTILTKVPHVVPINCNDTILYCKYKTLYVEDDSLMPKCESPMELQGLSAPVALKDYLSCKDVE